MKKIVILLWSFAVVCIYGQQNAGAHTTLKSHRIYNWGGDDRLTAVCPLSDGGYLLYGASSQWENFGDSTYFVLMKIDQQGDSVWSYCGQAGQGATNFLYSDGEYIYFTYSVGWPEVHLVKMNFSGRELWSRTLKPWHSNLISQCVDSEKKYIVSLLYVKDDTKNRFALTFYRLSDGGLADSIAVHLPYNNDITQLAFDRGRLYVAGDYAGGQAVGFNSVSKLMCFTKNGNSLEKNWEWERDTTFNMHFAISNYLIQVCLTQPRYYYGKMFMYNCAYWTLAMDGRAGFKTFIDGNSNLGISGIIMTPNGNGAVGFDFSGNLTFSIDKPYDPHSVSTYRNMYFSKDGMLWGFGDAMWNPGGSFSYPHNIFVECWSVDNITDVVSSSDVTPQHFQLYQNYPNPFNPITKIKYSISKESNVQIKVYDILGREVSTLVYGYKHAGTYEVEFDGSNFSSGIYFYRMQAGEFVDTKKFILMK